MSLAKIQSFWAPPYFTWYKYWRFLGLIHQKSQRILLLVKKNRKMSNLKITEFETYFEISFIYDKEVTAKEIVAILRTIQGRRYMALTKTWVIPKSSVKQLINQLKLANIQFQLANGEIQRTNSEHEHDDFSPMNKSFLSTQHLSGSKTLTNNRLRQIKETALEQY